MRAFFLLLTLGLAVSAAASAGPQSQLKYFYCIHSGRPCKETTPEKPVVSGNAMAVARRALATKDDFVGFVDAQDTTLQFKAEDGEAILVDLPDPKLQGSYSTHLDRAQALKLIDGLSAPLARYRAQLKLKFAKWQ
ncbi:MAG: hypothetical protein ABI609_08910 [Acidobacteriota bacterium]